MEPSNTRHYLSSLYCSLIHNNRLHPYTHKHNPQDGVEIPAELMPKPQELKNFTRISSSLPIFTTLTDALKLNGIDGAVVGRTEVEGQVTDLLLPSSLFSYNLFSYNISSDNIFSFPLSTIRSLTSLFQATSQLSCPRVTPRYSA